MRGLPLIHARAMPRQRTAGATPLPRRTAGECHVPACPTQLTAVRTRPFVLGLSRNAHAKT